MQKVTELQKTLMQKLRVVLNHHQWTYQELANRLDINKVRAERILSCKFKMTLLEMLHTLDLLSQHDPEFLKELPKLMLPFKTKEFWEKQQC